MRSIPFAPERRTSIRLNTSTRSIPDQNWSSKLFAAREARPRTKYFLKIIVHETNEASTRMTMTS